MRTYRFPFLLIVVAVLLVQACARYDARASFLSLLLLRPSTKSSSPSVPGVSASDPNQNIWWNAAYDFRRKIQFGCTHPAITPDHTFSIILDTTDPTRFQANGNDARIVWQPSAAAPVELDRVGYNWNTTSTRIDFRSQGNVAANACPEATDGSYFVYYKNAVATAAPANEAIVYYFGDFFNRPNSTTIGGGWSEWLQNTAGSVSADVLISGASLALKGGDHGAFLGANSAHWMESGATAQISPTAISQPFRVEFDLIVPERVDKFTNPDGGNGWARDSDSHIGLSVGDFATTAHRALIGGRAGETDTWIAANLLLGSGELSTPDQTFPGIGCPNSTDETSCVYFALKPWFNEASTANVINNAPGFTHNPGDWDPGTVGETATLKLRMDVTPGSSTYQVWLNDVLRMNSVPFIAPGASITHLRIFESHYADFLSITPTLFDATPPHRFDSLRVFYPAQATADNEEARPT